MVAQREEGTEVAAAGGAAFGPTEVGLYAHGDAALELVAGESLQSGIEAVGAALVEGFLVVVEFAAAALLLVALHLAFAGHAPRHVGSAGQHEVAAGTESQIACEQNGQFEIVGGRAAAHDAHEGLARFVVEHGLSRIVTHLHHGVGRFPALARHLQPGGDGEVLPEFPLVAHTYFISPHGVVVAVVRGQAAPHLKLHMLCLQRRCQGGKEEEEERA